MEKMSYGKAIREALYDMMRQDDSIIMMGEDIRHNLYMCTEGLVEEFGEHRIINVPLSESAFVGTAIGAAMCGLRPVVDLTISNFMYVAMDQIVNMAAKNTYQYNGQFKMPLTIIANSSYGGNAGAQHSDRPHPMFMNVPGLKVITPSTPQDVYSMLKTAIKDDDTVICFLDKSKFYEEQPVDRNIEVPLGLAKILKVGCDITIIGIQNMANMACDINEQFEREGVSAEIIDVRSLVPFDKETILNSVKKTGKVVIVDTAHRTCSAAANISSIIVEEAFEYLKAPIKIVATEDVPLPFASALEKELLPTKEKLYKCVISIVN